MKRFSGTSCGSRYTVNDGSRTCIYDIAVILGQGSRWILLAINEGGTAGEYLRAGRGLQRRRPFPS